MKARIFSILISIVLAAGIFTGCQKVDTTSQGSATGTSVTTTPSTTDAPGSTAAIDSATNSATAATAYPLTIKDAKGTEVTIKTKPVKIVSLPLGVCEMLLSLVDSDRMAAMTYYVDDPTVSNIADVVKGVGKRVDFNAEKIIALQPDLVLVDTWQDANTVKQLREANINVFVVTAAVSIDQEQELLKTLGKLTDTSPKADEIINWMDQKLNAVTEKLSSIKEEQKLSIIDYSEMGTTSGKDTNFDDIVKRAGLVNPVSKAGLSGWPQLSKEMVVQYNPDIIYLPSWYYDNKVSFESLSKSIKGDKSLAGVKAVKNNKIISISFNHITTTSQYSVLAVEEMAKAAYPELFK